MSPAVSEDEGFSDALGNFDVVIDTLGDEANLERVRYFEDGIEKTFGIGDGVASKLKRENNCQRYVVCCVSHTNTDKVQRMMGCGTFIKYMHMHTRNVCSLVFHPWHSILITLFF